MNVMRISTLTTAVGKTKTLAVSDVASPDWAAQDDHTVLPADWPHQIQL